MKTTSPHSTKDTKHRLLDAAEKLFADNGFEGTSLRQITTAAKANLAGVNYHFGSKEALVEAVFRRRVEPVNRERLEALSQLEQSGNPVLLEDVLYTFFAPPIRMTHARARTAGVMLRLYARLHGEPTESPLRLQFMGMFQEVSERYLAALRPLLPHLPRTELMLRFHFLIGAMAHTMSHSAMLKHIGCAAPDTTPEVFLNKLVTFAAAGLRASPTATEGAS